MAVTLCVGMHPASLQRCVTQSVTGGIPTQSVGTIKQTADYTGVLYRVTHGVEDK
jgi:hypothetical protein